MISSMALMVRAVSTVDQSNWRCTRISGGDASEPRGGGWLAVLHAIRCRFGVRIIVGVDASTQLIVASDITLWRLIFLESSLPSCGVAPLHC